MPASVWLTLRQAREAIAAGRPDEAHRLIGPLLAEGHHKAYKLAREVTRAYVARARHALDQHNADAAWRDLLAAETLNTGETPVTHLRKTLSRLGLVQARALLEAARPIDAIDFVARLRDRGVRHPDLDHIETVAQDWVHAAELADRGEFLRAIAELDRLMPKLPCPPTGAEKFRAEIEARHVRFRESVARLYDAAEEKRWREAVELAAHVLTVAPDHREAKAIRGKAWLAAAPATLASVRPPEDNRQVTTPTVVATWNDLTPPAAFAPTTFRSDPLVLVPPTPQVSFPASGSTGLPKRFFLWVDGVGGYLVCLANRVTFGQATADGPVDVPLFADVSRTHAEVTRDEEGYVIESGRLVRVNGADTKRAVLSAGDRVTLGTSCQFLFQKPVSVSSTARLELTSGHRLPVAVEGVLLMGNELVLGPGPEAHVSLPHVSAPVLIYRSKDGLGVRVPGEKFTIDDRPCANHAVLPLPSVVSAEAFTFAVEPVSNRL